MRPSKIFNPTSGDTIPMVSPRVFTGDSLNERHIPETYRAYHRNRLYVAAFLDAGRIDELLHANGFDRLQCVSLMRNRLSGALFRLFVQRFVVYRWVSPPACLALLLSDCAGRLRDEGYGLMVAARKPWGGTSVRREAYSI